MELITVPGVFRPISDSRLLADRIAREGLGPGSTVLDVCTGSGVLALAAAAEGADVTAIDVSRRAVATVKVNAFRHRLPVQALRGRSFEPVAGRRFDLVVSNPPYVPAPADDVPQRGSARAWAAGRDGRLVLDDLCDHVADHLEPGGTVLLVHSSLIGGPATLARLAGAGLEGAAIVERHPGPLGPLMREQQRNGLIPPDVDEEDVIIIRATAPRRRGELSDLALELHRCALAAPGLRPRPDHVSDDLLSSLSVPVSGAVAELCRAGWWRRAPDDTGYVLRRTSAEPEDPR